METQTRGKGTIDHGLRESMGTLDDMIPTRLSKRSQGCPLTHSSTLELWAHTFNMPIAFSLLLHQIFFATHSTEYPLFVLYSLAPK